MMGNNMRSLEIARAMTSRSMIGVARELGLVRPKPPTRDGARTFRRTLERLGTTFIKLGQLLSTRPDLVSDIYADELTTLQDSTQPMPAGLAREVVERSLGGSVDQLFTYFADEPLATGSIAQIHAAELASGDQVVVKVRRPDIGAQVQQDLEILDGLARRAESHVEAAGLVKARTIVDELTWSLNRELDLRQDAMNMKLIASQLDDFERIIVPRVHDDLVTEEVLVMQRIDGVKVTEAIDLEPPVADAMAEEFLRAYIKMILVDGIYHADPHAGNVLVTEDERLGLLDFGLVGRIDDNTRLEFGLILLAMAENRAEDFSDLLLRMSSTDRHSDEQTFHHEIRRLLPRYRRTPLSSVNVGTAMLEIQSLALRCRVGLPIQFALMGKTLSQVDSIARFLSPQIDPLRVVRAYSSEIAWGQLRDAANPSSMLAIAGSPMLSLLQLPRRTEHVLERLERGEITIGITPTELGEFICEMRTVTNRLATSIIVAAIVIASALLMNVDNVGQIAGYPALGFVGFVVASAIGLLVIIRMIRTKGGL